MQVTGVIQIRIAWIPDLNPPPPLRFCASPRDPTVSRCRSRNPLSLSPHVTHHSISTPKRPRYTDILEHGRLFHPPGRGRTEHELARDLGLCSGVFYFNVLTCLLIPKCPLTSFSLFFFFPFLMLASSLPWMSMFFSFYLAEQFSTELLQPASAHTQTRQRVQQAKRFLVNRLSLLQKGGVVIRS